MDSLQRGERRVRANIRRKQPRQGPHHKCALFDYFSGWQQDRLWDRKVECFCSLEIDDKLEFGCLFHRQIARPGALQKLINEGGGVMIHRGKARPVGLQNTSLHRFLLHE